MHAAIVLLVLVLTYLGMVAGRIAWLRVDRTGIALLAIIGGLSAVLANDILIVTIAPLLIAGAQSRGLDPRPFAIALAAATNAGSAATLIGNPQNILFGAMGHLDFWVFLGICGVPALFALVVVFAVVWLQWRGRMPESLLPESPEPL